MLMCDNSLIVWLIPHMKTESIGSLARNSFTFWCLTLMRFFFDFVDKGIVTPELGALILVSGMSKEYNYYQNIQ